MAVSNKYLQMTDTGGNKKREQEKVDKKELVEEKFGKGATNAVLKTGEGEPVAQDLPYTGGTPQMTLLNSNSSIKGVDQATVNKLGSSFNASDGTKQSQSEADAYLGKLKEFANTTDIIDQSTWDAINQKWSQPQEITEAFNYTNGLLQQLTSGRTSYTDQIKDMMAQIQNRDKFSYDVDSDTMFQQALASAMSSGKTAMQDTIGQASALTGGYGSTYATTAGNQAYNNFIQDAYDNLPQYYQMALEAYQMEGDEMYRQLGMLTDADATEYERMYNSWNANFTNAQSMYNRSYGEWQDSVNNAYNSANLQLNEHGQLYDQLYNTYKAVQDNANTKYAQEYQGWADEINNAFNIAKMANSDYWSSAELAQRQAEHNADIAYKYKALQQDNDQFKAKILNDNAKAQAEAGKLTKPTSDQMKDALRVRNEQGIDAYDDYLLQLEAMGVDTQQITMHVEANRDVSWLETLGVNATDAMKYFGTNAKDVWQNLWR
jgi:hypothetical protein